MVENTISVSGGTSLPRHNKSGRVLNIWDLEDQVDVGVLSSSEFMDQLSSYKIAERVAAKYKNKYPATRKDSLSKVKDLSMWLILNTDKYMSLRSSYKGYRQIRRIVDNLEKMGTVDVYQGFSSKVGSRPLAIKASSWIIDAKKYGVKS